MNYFAKNILYLRKKNNLKQDHMLTCVNITRATWSNYENAITSPGFDKLIEIAKFFRVRVDHLLLNDLETEETIYITGNELNETTPTSEVYKITPAELRHLNSWEITVGEIIQELKELRDEVDLLKGRVQN